nr:hypothetical protein [Pseudoalteromonas sp. S3431]
MANNQKEPLIVIEVQTGAVLNESDIERFDDKYGDRHLNTVVA